MIEGRLTNVDVPVRVRKPEYYSFGKEVPAKVLIEIPKYSMLMNEDQYNELASDPVAMNSFIREAISRSFKAQGMKWPRSDAIHASSNDR